MQGSRGLIVRDLAVARGSRTLVAGLSFTLAAGTALAVTGENGAGKSTLLRTLAGLLPAAAGRATLCLGAQPEEALAERTHYLGHANGLKAGLTVVEALRFRQRWAGGGGLSPADALAAVALPHCADIPTGLLSTGQKRRVALAGLLVAPRPLWLLDEPAAGLDAHADALLADLLRRHLAGGGLAVLALHAPLAMPMPTLRLGSA